MVQKEEAQATQKARETQAIADDAQRDLAEALPALVSRNCATIISYFSEYLDNTRHPTHTHIYIYIYICAIQLGGYFKNDESVLNI